MSVNCLFLPLNFIFIAYTPSLLPVLIVKLMSDFLKHLIKIKDAKFAPKFYFIHQITSLLQEKEIIGLFS